MDINLTLIGQIITFVLFVWFTMKFVWPPVLLALRHRQERVSNGLAAADRGLAELEMARKRAKELINTAKGEASIIIEKANLRAHKIEEEAHIEARNLAEQMKRSAKSEIDRMEVDLRESLTHEVIQIAMKGTEKLLNNLNKPGSKAVKASSSGELDQSFIDQLTHELSNDLNPRKESFSHE